MAGRLCRLVASGIACKSAVAKAAPQKMQKTRLSGVYMLRKGVLFLPLDRSFVHSIMQIFTIAFFQLPISFCFKGIAFLSKIAYTILEQNAMH